MRCDECVAELKNVSAGPGSEESELRSLLHKQTDVRGVIDNQEMRWKWEIYSRNLEGTTETVKPFNNFSDFPLCSAIYRHLEVEEGKSGK